MLRRENPVTATEPGVAILITGNTASGKSTLAKDLEEHMIRRKHVVVRLDGENVRQGLCGDLGFSMEDRDENLRRMAEVAALTRDHGVNVIIAAIAPLDRHIAQFKTIVGGDLVRVFMDTDEETRRARDTKGIYDMADHMAAMVPGVNAEWEPDVEAHHIIHETASSTDAAKAIYKTLRFPRTKWDSFFQGMA